MWPVGLGLSSLVHLPSRTPMQGEPKGTRRRSWWLHFRFRGCACDPACFSLATPCALLSPPSLPMRWPYSFSFRFWSAACSSAGWIPCVVDFLYGVPHTSPQSPPSAIRDAMVIYDLCGTPRGTHATWKNFMGTTIGSVVMLWGVVRGTYCFHSSPRGDLESSLRYLAARRCWGKWPRLVFPWQLAPQGQA
jgi:hypothetical protein